jgi:hypothetical protein
MSDKTDHRSTRRVDVRGRDRSQAVQKLPGYHAALGNIGFFGTRHDHLDSLQRDDDIGGCPRVSLGE